MYYGNRNAAAPRYDLDLAAWQLLAAEKLRASLGPAEDLKASSWAREEAGTLGHWIFWPVLGVVVVGLLVIIARLLPKNTGPEPRI